MRDADAPIPVDIADLRRRLGAPGKPLSQEDLGERLGGISQSTVSRMEADPSLQRGPVAVLLRSLDSATPSHASVAAA